MNISEIPNSSKHFSAWCLADAVKIYIGKPSAFTFRSTSLSFSSLPMCFSNGTSCAHNRYSSTDFSSRIFSTIIPFKHVPYFLYKSYAYPGFRPSLPTVNSSILSVKRFATVQSFLYKQSSKSQKMVAREGASPPPLVVISTFTLLLIALLLLILALLVRLFIIVLKLSFFVFLIFVFRGVAIGVLVVVLCTDI